jgi:hypothetical protein
MATVRRAVRATAIAALIGSLTAMLSVTPASATLQFYSIVLTVTSTMGDLPSGGCSQEFAFGCNNVGHVFLGEFAVDKSILSTDGWNDAASVVDFFLPFGAWGNYYFTPDGFPPPGSGCLPQTESDTPCNLFSGFLTRVPGSFFSKAPSFFIEGGQVVGLCCEVHDTGEAPWITLNYNNGGFFSAEVDGSGKYVIDPVPEPGSLVLFGGMLTILGLVTRHRSLSLSVPAR